MEKLSALTALPLKSSHGEDNAGRISSGVYFRSQKEKHVKASTLSLVLILAATSPAMAADLVTNGGFETGNLAGWSLTGDTSNSVVYSPGYEGNFTYLNGASASKAFLSQTIATTAGGHYDYSFTLLSAGGNPNEFFVSLGGAVFGPSYVNAPAFGYTVFTGSVIAPTSNAALTFAFRQGPHFWALDAVSLTSAVPEPASWALIVCGIGITATAIRRRRILVTRKLIS